MRLPVRNFKSSISLRAHCHIGTNPRKLGLVTVCTYIMTFRVLFYNGLGGAISLPLINYIHLVPEMMRSDESKHIDN